MKEHFDKIFWFACAQCAFVAVYCWAVTFFNIPKANHNYVNIILPFLLGTILGGCMGYMIGGSADSTKKTELKDKGVNAQISASITTDKPEINGD